MDARSYTSGEVARAIGTSTPAAKRLLEEEGHEPDMAGGALIWRLGEGDINELRDTAEEHEEEEDEDEAC